MSDGPYKSLQMRRAWKTVAERASNEAYPISDVRDAILNALVKDWRKEMTSNFVALLQEVCDDKTLFCRNPIEFLEVSRPQASGSAMRLAMLDNLVCAFADGASGKAAFESATTNTLIDHWARCARQVEEHYLRDSNTANTQNIHERINKAVHSAEFSSLTSQILAPESKPLNWITKRDGVDDGPQL